jgi:hypothetical protein
VPEYVEGEARSSATITPHDTNPQPTMRAIYVGGAGAITGRLRGDAADRVFAGLQAGQIYPFAFILIKAAGTTATSLVALL